MELSPTTFVLEIINFLFLVWLLKRLFFGPIKKTIEARRQEIRKSIADAESRRKAAEDLQRQYETRLKEWEIAKSRQWDQLNLEIGEERQRRRKEMVEDLNQERDRLKIQGEKEELTRREGQEREAILQSLRFASIFLQRLATPELQSSIVRLFIESFHSVTGEPLSPIKGVRDQWLIRSAFPIDDKERQQLIDSLRSNSQREVSIDFEVDQSLLAGLELVGESSIFEANLRNELKYFSKVEINDL